jgi:hypothetical protein
MRPVSPEEVPIARMAERGKSGRSDLDVEDLTTAIHAVLGVHPVGAEGTAIGGVLGKLGSLKGVGGAAVGAAAFGLLAFRICHGRKELEVKGGPKKAAIEKLKGRIKERGLGASSVIIRG